MLRRKTLSSSSGEEQRDMTPPVDDHTLPVRRFLDGDQSEAFREPDLRRAPWPFPMLAR